MTAKSGGDPREARKNLQGPERVAALLLAMGKPLAERLLPHFEPGELREISRCAVALGRVPDVDLEALIEDFANQFAAGLNLLVSAREFENLLTGVIPPEQPPDEGGETAAPEDPSTIWEKVSRLSETVIAEYLSGEHPQTVALVVSNLAPAMAAKVMTELPAALRDGAMRRMLGAKPATEAGLRVVASALEADLLQAAARESGADPHERLARIINNMDRDQMEGFLQNLGDARPQSAEILKGLLFSFDDLSNLSDEARASLLDKVSSDQLVLALKGTEAAFRESVLAALPARARRAVENELNRNEATPQRDVAQARRDIVNIALEMAERGEIQLKSGDEQQSDRMVA